MSRILTGLNRLAARAAALPRATGGNLSILFGFSLIPLVGLVGLGVDYGMAMSTKTKLNAAADAAALAAVVTTKAYIAANPTDPNLNANAIAAGQRQAINSFNVNAGKVPYTTVNLSPAPVVTRTGQRLDSTVVIRRSCRTTSASCSARPRRPSAAPSPPPWTCRAISIST